MLSTLRATLSPSGTLSFDDPLRITKPVRVLVTLLDEQPGPVRLAAGAAPGDDLLQGGALDTPIVGEDPARATRWRQLLALREQAIAEGMPLLDWDEINAEVRERAVAAKEPSAPTPAEVVEHYRSHAIPRDREETERLIAELRAQRQADDVLRTCRHG